MGDVGRGSRLCDHCAFPRSRDRNKPSDELRVGRCSGFLKVRVFKLVPPDKFKNSFAFRIFISHEILDRGHSRCDGRHGDIGFGIRNRDVFQSDHHGVVVDRRGDLFLVRVFRRDLTHQRLAHERGEGRAEARAGVPEIREVDMLVSLGVLRGLAREDM